MLVVQSAVESTVAANYSQIRPTSIFILLCLGGRSHEAYSSLFVCLFVSHYASVGGATRHTVIALSVSHSVIQSVCYIIFAAYAER